MVNFEELSGYGDVYARASAPRERSASPMDDALAAIEEARVQLGLALDIIEKRRDMPDDVDELRSTVGYLAGVVARWSRERDRWR